MSSSEKMSLFHDTNIESPDPVWQVPAENTEFAMSTVVLGNCVVTNAFSDPSSKCVDENGNFPAYLGLEGLSSDKSGCSGDFVWKHAVEEHSFTNSDTLQKNNDKLLDFDKDCEISVEKHPTICETLWSHKQNCEFATNLSLGNELTIIGNNFQECNNQESDSSQSADCRVLNYSGHSVQSSEDKHICLGSKPHSVPNTNKEQNDKVADTRSNNSSNDAILTEDNTNFIGKDGKTVVIPIIKVPTLTVTRVHLLDPKTVVKASAADKNYPSHQKKVPAKCKCTNSESTSKSFSVQRRVRAIYKPRCLTESDFSNSKEKKRQSACVRERDRNKNLNDAFLELGKAVGICTNEKIMKSKRKNGPNSTLQRRKFRVVHIDPMADFTEEEFQLKYCLPKKSVMELASKLIQEGLTSHQLDRKSSVLTVCLAMSYLVTGMKYHQISDMYGVSKATVAESVRLTVELLVSLRDQYLYFPRTEAERKAIALRFIPTCKIPCIVGVIDSMHFDIKCSAIKNPAYTKVKGTYSINLQVICDADGRFLDLDGCWCGGLFDDDVWGKSLVSQIMEGNRVLKGFILLGDNTFPLTEWLLTPYEYPSTDPERRYNLAHSQCRAILTQAIQNWKKTFRCIDGDLESSPGFCSRMVMATAVLHNMAVNEKLARTGESDPERNGPSPKPNPEKGSDRSGMLYSLLHFAVNTIVKILLQ